MSEATSRFVSCVLFPVFLFIIHPSSFTLDFMPASLKRILVALVIVVLLIAVNATMSDAGLFGFGVPPYSARILMLVGINVILAVSLNLINGFTGQFSIGHAGFMAIGAYSSAYLTVYHGQAWERSLAGALGDRRDCSARPYRKKYESSAEC